MNTNCCYRCARREVGCHSKCADYKIYKNSTATIKYSKERNTERMMRCYNNELARRLWR